MGHRGGTEGALCGLDADQCVTRCLTDGGGKCRGALVEFLTGHDLVEQPPPFGAFRIEGGARRGEQQCPTGADERRQPFDTSPRRHDAEGDLVEGDPNIICCQPEVARHGYFCATTECAAIDDAEHWDG